MFEDMDSTRGIRFWAGLEPIISFSNPRTVWFGLF